MGLRVGCAGPTSIAGLHASDLDRGQPLLGRGSGDGALRVDQIGRLVGRPAVRTVVAVLVGRLATGAASKHETIGQEDAGLGIVETQGQLQHGAARSQQHPVEVTRLHELLTEDVEPSGQRLADRKCDERKR